ncbi:PAS domain-containing protein [Geminocystis sp. NIES-3709]|uniref:PAS domain-containing protein n=1 Tax=Geminocystis sp. NIES-3709 TaxID=1617448 RepID=UPI00130D8518|nr:PAS domain-containing protein [Geminocystis sp. NIES-3709]
MGIYKLREDFTFAYVSPVWCRLNNIKEQDVLDHPHLAINIIHPDDQDYFLQKNIETLIQKSSFNETTRFIINNQIRWMRIQSKPHQDDQGKWFWFGTITDITEQKQAEIEFQQTKDQLQNVISSLTEVLWSISVPNFKVIYVSPSVEKIYGIPLKEWMEDYTLWSQFIHPEDQGIVDVIWQNMETKGYSQTEYRIVTHEGEIKWVSSKAKYVQNEQGIIIRIDGIVTDITENQLIKIALAESEARLKNLIDYLPGVAYQCLNDEDYTAIFISDEIERLTGYKTEDFITNQISLQAIIHPDYRNNVRKQINQFLEEKKCFEIQYIITTIDNQELWVYEKGRGVYDRNAQLKHIEGLIFDITKQKNTETELQNINQQLIRKEQMLS